MFVGAPATSVLGDVRHAALPSSPAVPKMKRLSPMSLWRLFVKVTWLVELSVRNAASAMSEMSE